jgi:DNA-binding transcriptional ArsR family regulator
MGITKTEGFSSEVNELAVIFKALGHPARMAIIELLLKKKDCICGDIVNELPLAQATISQHLRELKTAGIIIGTVEGTSVCYCLNVDLLKKLAIKVIQFTEDAPTGENLCC